MISLCTGLPGTGKSLNLIARFLLPALKAGRKCYTNLDGLNALRISIYLDLPFEEIQRRLIFIEKVNTQYLIEHVDKNSLVLIDEAQIYWSNRDYKSEENLRLLPFLQKHRHLGLDFVFFTQMIDQVDVGIRRLTEVHYRLSRMSHVGLDKVVRVKVFPDAMGSEAFTPIALQSWKIDSRIFPLYSSHQSGAVELKVRKNVLLQNTRLWVYLAIFLASIGWITYQSKTKESILVPQANKLILKSGWEEYYCSDNLYVKYPTRIDTMPTSKVSTTICPKLGYHKVKK